MFDLFGVIQEIIGKQKNKVVMSSCPNVFVVFVVSLRSVPRCDAGGHLLRSSQDICHHLLLGRDSLPQKGRGCTKGICGRFWWLSIFL